MEEEKRDSTKEKVNGSLRLPKYLLVGLIGLQVAVLAITMLVLKGRGGGGGEGDSSSSLLPIWLVIFIPIIASRRKAQTEEQKSK